MWSPPILRLLTVLAGQDYDGLWKFVLMLLFPACDGFTVTKKEGTSSYDSQTIYVDHKSGSEELLSLTWSAPRKFIKSEPSADPSRFGCRMRSGLPNRISRIHCEGTKLTLYTLLRAQEDAYYSPDPPLKHHGFGREYWDSDLLESLGFDRLVSHARKVREDVGLFEECWVPNTSQCVAITTFAEAGIELTTIGPSLSCAAGAVSQVCTRKNSSPQSSGPSFFRLPVELILLALDHLDTTNVRNFALCSKVCNEMVERRLWYTFVICTHGKTGASRALKRCQAILRNPRRARRISKLIVGPCTWVWTPALIHHISSVWHMVPHLKALMLEMPTIDHIDTTRGGEFAPLLRSLVKNGSHLRLEVFKYEGWLIPGSYLYQFLLTQTGLRQLIGVDMFPTRLMDCPKEFLPSLRLLVSVYPEIAIRLVPGRHIAVLQVDKIYEAKEFQAVCLALQTCPGPLEDIGLNVSGSKIPFAEYLQTLKPCLTNTKTLRARGTTAKDGDIDLLCDLSSLETVHLQLATCWDPALLSSWPSRFSPSIGTTFISHGCLRNIMYQRRGESSDSPPFWELSDLPDYFNIACLYQYWYKRYCPNCPNYSGL